MRPRWGGKTRGEQPQPLPSIRLSTDTQPRDQRTVALDVGAGQVVEQSATTTNEQQQSAAAVVIVLVLFEVFGEVGDPVAQKSYLNLGAAGVAVSRGVLADDLLLGGSIH